MCNMTSFVVFFVIHLIQFSSASKAPFVAQHDAGWELERRLLLMKDAHQQWKINNVDFITQLAG